MNFDQVIPGNTAADTINQNLEAARAAGHYGRRYGSGIGGLVLGYYGAILQDGTAIPDGTLTLTGGSTCRVVADRTTGAVSFATNTTNWNNTAAYMRVAEVTTSGTGITAYVDSRPLGGLSSGGSGTVTSVAYSFDASLADVFSIGGSPITSSGTLTASAVDPGSDLIPFWDDSAGKLTWLTVGSGLSLTGTTLTATGGGGGSGDVVGPGSAVNERIAVFDGTTGKLIKDGGTTIAGLRTPNVQSVSSAGTVTPTFSNDAVKITAQAAALTLANPTGTAIDMLGMVIRIKDNGTARAISYGTQYRAIGVTLPITTVVGKTTYLAMIYNSDDTKWDVVAVGQEP